MQGDRSMFNTEGDYNLGSQAIKTQTGQASR